MIAANAARAAWGYPPIWGDLSSPNESSDELTAARTGDLSETKEDNKATKGRRDSQVDHILETAKNLNYVDLLNIPEGGKAAIKAKCLQNIKGFTDSNFKRAWAAADKRGLIRMTDKQKYLKNQ